MKELVLKKRSIWFHIIVGYLTIGIWVIIYFYYKSKNTPPKLTNYNREFHSKATGVTFTNEDGTSRQKILSKMHTGELLDLYLYEYEKEKFAIGIKNCKNEVIGNISADLFDEIKDCLEKDLILRVEAEITGGNGKNYGCNLTFYIK